MRTRNKIILVIAPIVVIVLFWFICFGHSGDCLACAQLSQHNAECRAHLAACQTWIDSNYSNEQLETVVSSFLKAGIPQMLESGMVNINETIDWRLATEMYYRGDHNAAVPTFITSCNLVVEQPYICESKCM
jgi:hypothetical protein